MDCDHFLCQECQKAHGRMTLMKSHKIYTLAQLQSGQIVYKSKLRDEVPKCCKHPDQNLNVYCNSCERVICTTCSVLDHAKHSLTGLPEAAEKCKKKVTDMVRKSENRKTEMSSTIEETCKSRKELDTMFANAQKKLSKKAKEEITKIKLEVARIELGIPKIQKEEQKLKQEMDRIYQHRVRTFEAAQATNRKEVTQTEHKLEEVKQLMNQASCCEILELQQKLLHNLGELTGKQPQQVPDKLTFMDFEEGERSLGRLILEEEPQAAARSCVKEKWELKTEVKNFELRNAFIAHVASLSSNKIFVLSKNYTGNSGALFTASIPTSYQEPSPIPQRLHINGLTDDVRCIAVSKDGKLFVLDGPEVKVFNKQHQLLHQFTPGRGSDSQPTCLAVDDSNLMAVGYKGQNEISLHNPDGSLIRRMSVPMIGNYLTVYNHCLIYTSWKNKMLVCVDYYGASVFSVDISIQGGWYPNGVCCGSDGNIYIAVGGYSTGFILHYSPDGKYIGCVIKGCGRPRGTTFTSDGDLVVAAEQLVKVYHQL
ncbi:E3 ubiquitin-protein ligase TRIM71-like [Patiria miniata]|uniref:B box-type domain-containing protein n=1 Tax=Patiria miniata TaxID=46514 RepID=A0A913ZUF3_PATMI|nr:E3 ubiquitin-protein ligase TRIM71-like [Patiria miniata]